MSPNSAIGADASAEAILFFKYILAAVAIASWSRHLQWQRIFLPGFFPNHQNFMRNIAAYFATAREAEPGVLCSNGMLIESLCLP